MSSKSTLHDLVLGRPPCVRVDFGGPAESRLLYSQHIAVDSRNVLVPLLPEEIDACGLEIVLLHELADVETVSLDGLGGKGELR